MNKKILSFIFILSTVFANTGKISGIILDSKSGEPLAGVNVFLDDTPYGSATNTEGEYIILNVPPGDYTLRATYIGYASYRVNNVRVNLDRTTYQNFELKEAVIEGEEVIVVADRPLIQKDLTASQKITTADEMKVMPVETFLGVLTTQAGVNQGAGGELHIRGGRSNEVGYYIDGVSVANPFFTNGLAVNISNKALEEMKVVSGAFNAEYGNAMSGIVNLQVKDGGKDYHGSFSYQSGDHQSTDKDIFTHIDHFSLFTNKVLEGTLNGPMPFMSDNGKFTFNISGRYSNSEGYYYGIREHTIGDSANFRDANNWYIEMNGDSAFVPMAPSDNLNLMSKLTYRVSPLLKLSLQILHSGGKSQSYSHYYKFNPDGTSTSESSNNNFSIKINHSLGKRSFYEANLSYSNTDYMGYQFKPINLNSAEHENDESRFGSGQYVLYNQFDNGSKYWILNNSKYVPTSRIKGSPASSTFSFGGSNRGHSYRKSKSLAFKLDYTNQLTNRHALKTGVNFRRDNLDERNFTVLYDNQVYRVPTILPENDSPSHNHYNNTATFFSGYIQDKIEYNDFITNVGVRFDQFNPDENYITDFLNPDGEKEKAENKIMISPRIGVAFPITEKGILHFSYGHFYQMPTLRRLYKKSIFGAGLAPTVGYADLKPEKTILYEFGLQQQIGEIIGVEMSAFYKDIRDLLAIQSIRYESERYGPSNYSIYMNKDYGNVKGYTFSLTKRYDPKTKTSAFVDYTYQITEGNSVNSGSFYYNALSGEEEEKRIVPLSWDQRHIFNTNVSIGDPGNWNIGIISKLSSGWPYTPNIPNANYVPQPNSGRKPLQWRVDMRIHKNFILGKYNYILYAKIYNLLDRRNERYVFNDTGRAGYTYVFQSTQETQGFKKHYGEPGVHQWSEYQVRPHYYTPPRSINIGLSLDF
ncbi:MAG: TonB-dependent receptor [Candidatus Marinimicrobia bacterium]|nr:TonB-dependent receptor [Candidatus Neomarinimicrobiota bacterium]